MSNHPKKQPSRPGTASGRSDISSRLLGIAATRSAERYRCSTCAAPASIACIKESLRAMLDDPGVHRHVTVRDLAALIEQVTGNAVKTNTLLLHLNNHEPMYREWKGLRGR